MNKQATLPLKEAKKAMRRVNVKETLAIHKMLETVIEQTETPGIVIYAAGWDDARVAAAIGGGVTAANVAHIRRSSFGDLRPIAHRGETVNVQFGILSDKLDAIKATVEKILSDQNALLALKVSVDKLAKSL